MYGKVVQGRGDEMDEGVMGIERMYLGSSDRLVLENMMRRYVVVEAAEPRQCFSGKDRELANCVREENIMRRLANLHEGHVHFPNNITLAQPPGKVYWLLRARDMGFRRDAGNTTF